MRYAIVTALFAIGSVIVIVLLAGCATPPIPPEQAAAIAKHHADQEECAKFGNAVAVGHPAEAPKAVSDATVRCMHTKGYR